MELIKSGVTYTLPTWSQIKGYGVDIRTKNEARAFTHGRVETGDGKVDQRAVEMEFLIVGTSISDHDSQLDLLQAALVRPDQILKIRADRYLNISRCDKIKHTFEAGFGQTRAKLSASLLAADPFWYSTTDTTVTQAVTTTPTTFSVTNSGNVDAAAIVTLTAAASCTNINLVNTTDGSRQFQLQDTQLTTGQVAIINAVTGTVYRNTNNIINAFSGVFLKVLPGVNSFTYTGGNCSLEVKFTPRWL